MMSNPFFLISILLSSWIAFTTVSIVVESCLILFKIKNGRMSAILRSLPFISLLADLLFRNSSIGHWLNPLNCSSCVQKFLLTYIFPKLHHYLYANDIPLISYLGSKTSHTLFVVAFVIFLTLSLYFVLRVLFQGLLLRKMLQSMILHEKKCDRPIKNVLLSAAIKKHNVKIFVSDEITIPVATYGKAIFMPLEIVENFETQEYETILAHELEHLIWKDPITRFFIQLISAAFFFVPTKKWLNKLEFDQESACDSSILKYGLDKEFLASALFKVTSLVRGKTNSILCYMHNEKHPSLRRIQIMLGLNTPYSKRVEWMSYTIVILAALIALSCALCQ